ncbi:MAG: monofunctional biosynthetic peptidoglycan transglycosylase [Chitinophagaceae bacterium]|nr:monofunctional biosynthetic peptidoglycan transglycosylase [Chitinophagaceae bacterium]
MQKAKKKKRSHLSKIVSVLKKIILYGFILSVFYAVFCKWVDPPITLTQLNSILLRRGLNRDYVSMDQISPNIKLAVMCGEDQLFPDHDGFDFKSIQKAMKHNQRTRSLRGASTISQQAAKNVFLWQHGGYFRKGLEVYFTFMIEHLWSKKRILEVYLNVAEMGKGVFGVEAASKKYFNKHASELSKMESAMIAACLPNPIEYTIKPLSAHVSARSGWIMNQMEHLQVDPDIRELTR